jgi:Mrp family chromosome partitioning ATPase
VTAARDDLLALRVGLGLGDQELEQRLRADLEAAPDLVLVAQCLAADQLLELVQSHQVDALVVAWTLHRLTDSVLAQLERPGVTLVLLVSDPHEPRWSQRAGPVLDISSDAAAIRQAIGAARAGGRWPSRPAPPPDTVPLKREDRPVPEAGGVIAVSGGSGSPGRTTLAINLATALAAAASTVFVELDLCAPAVAAYVDADPSRNVCTLAHAVRDDPHSWEAALADELQPLGSGARQALLLCGPPKREMRTSVGAELVGRLLDELAQRYRWVIVDVGPEWLGFESLAASHRAGLARADHVVLVTAADFVGLWHARTALDQLDRVLGIDRTRVNLVLNRHDSRFHHSRQEVEWHLGAPVIGLIPFDQAGLQRAIAEQRPVVLDSSSRAGRAMVELAAGLHADRLQVPVGGSTRARLPWWRRIVSRQPVSAFNRPFARAGRPPAAAMSGSRTRA